MVESSRFCNTCERPTRHTRPGFGAGALLIHGVLCFLTMGLWLPILVLHALSCITARSRCQFCGR